MTGLLKRKFEEVYKDNPVPPPCPPSLSSQPTPTGTRREELFGLLFDSTLQQPWFSRHSITNSKRARCGRGNVTLDMVTVFLSAVPGLQQCAQQRGCSLGMVQRHSALRRYTLTEYAVAQRTLRKEKLLTRLREEKLEALKLKVKRETQITNAVNDLRHAV
ncbi:hypothetical protein DPEC_G00368170 [Dallia pectoralis]|nr:hypothetical protein DPEC_G00368170 [Dallia pectoralis]